MSFSISEVRNVISVGDSTAMRIMLMSFLDPNTEFPARGARDFSLRKHSVLIPYQVPDSALERISLLGWVASEAIVYSGSKDEQFNKHVDMINTVIESGADINNVATKENGEHVSLLDFLWDNGLELAGKIDDLNKKNIYTDTIPKMETAVRHYVDIIQELGETGLVNISPLQDKLNDLDVNSLDERQSNFVKQVMLAVNTEENLTKGDPISLYDYEI